MNVDESVILVKASVSRLKNHSGGKRMLALAMVSWIICGILSYGIFKGYFRNLHEEVFGKHYDDFLTGVKAELKARGKDLSEKGLIYARETWKKRKGYRWQEEITVFWGVSAGLDRASICFAIINCGTTKF